MYFVGLLTLMVAFQIKHVIHLALMLKHVTSLTACVVLVMMTLMQLIVLRLMSADRILV